MKQFASYQLTINTNVNLPPVLMTYDLQIQNIIKENEASDMQQFTSYQLTTKTKVNLLAVLMMYELLIKNIIKKMKHEI